MEIAETRYRVSLLLSLCMLVESAYELAVDVTAHEAVFMNLGLVWVPLTSKLLYRLATSPFLLFPFTALTIPQFTFTKPFKKEDGKSAFP